jgi:hypothetical protein
MHTCARQVLPLDAVPGGDTSVECDLQLCALTLKSNQLKVCTCGTGTNPRSDQG